MFSILERLETENPPWCEAGKVFIKSVTKLLERLLDYRNVMQGDENRDKRMSCTVNLLNFYKSEIDRKEMYLRYVKNDFQIKNMNLFHNFRFLFLLENQVHLQVI